MEKKKGFSLIEVVLAIAILALILVISVPKILDILVEIDRKSYQRNVEEMMQIALLEYETNEENLDSEMVVYMFSNGEFANNNTLNFKGDIPYSGSITLTNDKKIIIDNLISKNKKWCAIKEEKEDEIQVVEITSKGECAKASNIIIGSIKGTTNSLTIPFIVQDEESDIEEVNCYYSLDNSYKNIGKIEGNECKLTNLKSDKTYNFKIVAKNAHGRKSEKSGSGQTTNFNEIEMVLSSTKWEPSKTVTIIGSQAGTELEYKIVSGTTVKTDWTKINSGENITIDWAANQTIPTYIYARLNDGVNTSGEETLTVTTVDPTPATTTNPSVISSTTNPTKAVVVVSKQADPESGIISKEYGYATSETGTYSWGTSSTISGLTQGETYYFKTRVKNGAGIGWTESTATEYAVTQMTTCSISMSDAGVWKTSKAATITGSQTGVTLQYKIVSGTTVKTDWTTISSGDAKTVNWDANSSTPTYVYCRMTDETNALNGSTYTETHIDTVVPTAPVITGGSGETWVNSNKTISIQTAGKAGASGIKHYQYLIQNYLYNGSAPLSYTLSSTFTKSGSKFTSTGNDPYISFTNLGSPKVTAVEVYFNSALTTNVAMQIFYAASGASYTQANSVTQTIASGSTSFKIDIPDGNYNSIRFDFGNKSGVTFDIKYILYLQEGTTSNNLTVSGNGQNIVYYKTVSNSGLTSSWSATQKVKLDKIAPTCGSWSGGSTTWTKNSRTVYVGCSDTGGSQCVSSSYPYQYNTTTKTATPSLTIKDNAGNSRTCTSSSALNIYVDKTAPSTPKITYNSGSNSHAWQNNYNLTLSSTDNVGIARYEIDTNGDGVVDKTTGSNFIPTNGWNSCATRFRAVDTVGNVSGWTSNQHIHMAYASVYYSTYLEDHTYEDGGNGTIGGTVGKSKAMEKLYITVDGQGISGSIAYQVHQQTNGTLAQVTNGNWTGYDDKRIEQIRIWLTGNLANIFNVYYRVHVRNQGWLNVVANGTWTGSSGLCKRIEAIQIQIVPNGMPQPSFDNSGSNVVTNATVLTGSAYSNCGTSEGSSSGGSSCTNQTCYYTATCWTTRFTGINSCYNTYNGNCTVGTTSDTNCNCKYPYKCTKSYTCCK